MKPFYCKYDVCYLVETKRLKRMRKAGTEKSKVETYDSLVKIFVQYYIIDNMIITAWRLGGVSHISLNFLA